MAAIIVPTAIALLSSALAAQTNPEASQSEPAKAVAEVSGPADRPPSAQAIIITGSRIPRRNLTAVSPVTMIKRDEITLQGTTLTEELINQLPQVTPDQGAFISTGASGTA